jgi:hypothetical protein
MNITTFPRRGLALQGRRAFSYFALAGSLLFSACASQQALNAQGQAITPTTLPDFSTDFSFPGGETGNMWLRMVGQERQLMVQGNRCFLRAVYSATTETKIQTTPHEWTLLAHKNARVPADAAFCGAGQEVKIHIERTAFKRSNGEQFVPGHFYWGNLLCKFEVTLGA